MPRRPAAHWCVWRARPPVDQFGIPSSQAALDFWPLTRMAALRFSATGTHTGELMGMPPTGKQINISGMCMFRISDGKVTEWAEVFDQMTLMQQIGAIPTPGQEAQVATA